MTVVDVVYQLATFSESERRTLRLIAGYLREKGQRCFTYRGLRGYYNKNRLYMELEWHTAERNIRRLAELGWLERRGSGRSVYFCLTEKLETLYRQLGWL